MKNIMISTSEKIGNDMIVGSLIDARRELECNPNVLNALQLIDFANSKLQRRDIDHDTFMEHVTLANKVLRGYDDDALLCAKECVQKISEGWGEQEDEKAVKDIAPIIQKYLTTSL